MAEDTFGLTQVVNSSRRLVLPALISPRSYSTRNSTEVSPLSLSTSKKLSKSTAARLKASDALLKVKADVKSSFDLLYSTNRSQLLPKAMEIEHSESVRDQFQSLEAKVAGLLKASNTLHNKVRAKEQLLVHLQKELESVEGRDPDLKPAISSAEETHRKVEQTAKLLELELDYTTVLEYMVSEGCREVLRRAQPLYHLRKELQQLKIRFHESEVDLLRTSMEHKSLQTTLRRSTEHLTARQTHHAQKVQEKVLEFKRREEFTEFVARNEAQKALEARIKDNERDAKAIERVKNVAEEEEVFLEASKTHFEELNEYEKQTEKLSRAAHTGSIQQVLEYWEYLREFGNTLQAKVESGTQRVSELRSQLSALMMERTNVRLLLGPSDSTSASQLSRLKSQLESKEDEIGQKFLKVTSTQLESWRQATAAITTRLQSLHHSLSDESPDLPLAALLQSVEVLISAKLPD